MRKRQTHSTTSLAVGFACQATTQVNSPCVIQGDIDPIAQSNGTDPARNVPSDNRDYLEIFTLSVAYTSS
jgi:hypothetical protein